MRKHQSGRPAPANLDGLEIAIIGRACRLPGANSAGELWDLLSAGRCTVSRIPPDRWPLERLAHPRPKERGRSYSWAAGVLDDSGASIPPFSAFPRARPNKWTRSSGCCSNSLGKLSKMPEFVRRNLPAGKPACSSAARRSIMATSGCMTQPPRMFFATGNSLAILSNRISYVFDLHGPSFTVDTACSSSLVALDAAVAAIQCGRIDTAIVGGVNILASPFGFISFSQATMLSPTGLCRAFSANADGYVRAEGEVVLVLRALGAARAYADRIHAVIAGSHSNSDGRTTGISFPSKAHQAALLERAYLKNGFNPDAIAFVEAHGTGTRAGDPIEAAAIGEVLGQRRTRPLPIGSIKTNIGHTEPASGLAGLLKAMLALEHDELPRSLHFDEPIPDIPFADLNLLVCAAPLALPRNGRVRYAGISSLGFGGTNAHVILADPPLSRNGTSRRSRLGFCCSPRKAGMAWRTSRANIPFGSPAPASRKRSGSSPRPATGANSIPKD